MGGPQWPFADPLPEQLTKHIMLLHTDYEPYVCEYCGQRYADKFDLHYHARYEHADHPLKYVKTYDDAKQVKRVRVCIMLTRECAA